MKIPAWFAVVLLSSSLPGFAAAMSPESIHWPDTVIPLPQEMAVSDTVRLPPGQVGFAVPTDASAMVTQAVGVLRAAYQEKSGCAPTGTVFTIHIGRLSADDRVNGQAVGDVDRLRQAPHADQA